MKKDIGQEEKNNNEIDDIFDMASKPNTTKISKKQVVKKYQPTKKLSTNITQTSKKKNKENESENLFGEIDNSRAKKEEQRRVFNKNSTKVNRLI